MGKTEVAASSLVLAIPAGALAYFTILAGLQHTEDMPTLLMAVVWATAAVSVVMALFPIGTMLFMKSVPVAVADGPASRTGAVPSGTEDVSGVDELEDDADPGRGTAVIDDGNAFDDSAMDMDLADEDSVDNLEPADDLEDELALSDDEFSMDEIEEEDEAPKKKKKK